jgi:hypothetical protein
MLLCDTDFYEWTAQSAELLRQHRLQDLDLEHLAEEIEALGNATAGRCTTVYGF